jgi:hypothetical protein
MIDLAHYNFKHQRDLEFATKRAEYYIGLINDKSCCDDCVTEVDCEMDTSKAPLSKFNHLHDLIQAVLFSSGVFGRFTTKYKKKNTYHLNVWLKKMTAEQKAECHKGMTDDTEEDPEAMDMD